MARSTIALLRAVLVILFLNAVVAQVIIPFAGYKFVTESFPEVRSLLVPYCVAAVLAFACVEASVVAIWKLLSMVRDDQIFTGQAFRWVNVLIVSPALAAGLSALVVVHMVFASIGNATAVAGMAGLVALGVGISLVMIVMRQLLRTAVGYRDELSQVI